MTTYYVNPTSGNDTTGDGTSLLPWLLVSKANTESINGDTIIIQAGTHTMTNTTMGYFTSARTYQGELDAYNQNSTILDMNGAYLSVFLGTGSATTTLDKLNFTNINTTDLTISGAANNVFDMDNTGSIVTVTNCLFNGVALGSSGQAGRHGLFGEERVSVEGILNVNNCTFRNMGTVAGATGGSGVIFGGTQLSIRNYTLEDNTFDLTASTDTSTQVDAIFANRIVSMAEDNVIVIRNSVFYNPGSSIDLTIHGVPTTGSNTLDADYSDNTFYGTYAIDANTTGGIGNALTGDPLFVDPVNGNYNLRPDLSPIIGDGVTI